MTRTILTVVPVAVLLGLAGCWNFDGHEGGNNTNLNNDNTNGNDNTNTNTNTNSDPITGEFQESYLLSGERKLDLLFVIDNSGSMAGEQAQLRANFGTLINELRDMFGGLPDLHVGVTTTDLGTGMFQITYCQMGGDAGALQTGLCANPTGAPYIVDTEPQGCTIAKNPDNTCTTHDCVPTDCVAEPSSTFVVDSATGCPRCRNYGGEALVDVFSCVADLGTMGCGFEQPLEAMYKALDPGNMTNAGFVRDNAYLAVVFVTDEDDCSAADPQLFDTTQIDIGSTLGPLTSYRCFEFGITCDIDERTHQGLRQNCVPREDTSAMLHPVSRYANQLLGLKDRRMVVMAALAGPAAPSAQGEGYDAVIGLDGMSNPQLQFTCTTTMDGAVPGIRLRSLVEQFNVPGELSSWAYRSICDTNYDALLGGVGDKLDQLMGTRCLPAVPAGCADIGAELATPTLACGAPNPCVAQCTAVQVSSRFTPGELRTALTPCLHVLADGSVDPTNIDPTLAYWSGHPETLDSNLPVEACWHITHEPGCTQSNQAAVAVSRQTLPPPSTYVELSCDHLYPTEADCENGIDDDQDCLDDNEDPDCQ